MLYSIIPEEVIFQGIESVKRPQEISYKGHKFLAEPLEQPGQFRLVQLLSTEPSLYLEAGFQPGTVVSFPAAPLKDKDADK